MVEKEYEFQRTNRFRKNILLEGLLEDMNNDLWSVEKELVKKQTMTFPIVFIVGPIRSGSTLMMQWLADSRQFAYSTNLLSRFYKAPIIGAKIQLLLTDEKYNYRNEIIDFNSRIDYKSSNGKTTGALSPNSFLFFWKRFIDYSKKDYMTDEELFANVDTNLLKNELFGIANIFKKAFAIKAMILNYNIAFLSKVFDNAFFIYTKRDPMKSIESIIDARKRQYGDIDKWFSFRIPEYSDLIKNKDPFKEAAGQVFYSNKAIQKGLDTVEDKRKMIVSYEEFCTNPEKYYFELQEKMKKLDYCISDKYEGPKSFEITRKNSISNEAKIAYEWILQKEGVLG